MIRYAFIFITLLLSNVLSSNDGEQHWVKKHTCDKQECPEGRCHFENCENPTSCDGGLCVFVNCNKPSCSGGLCTFTECTHPRCGGGKCEFQDTKVRFFPFLCSSISNFNKLVLVPRRPHLCMGFVAADIAWSITKLSNRTCRINWRIK